MLGIPAFFSIIFIFVRLNVVKLTEIKDRSDQKINRIRVIFWTNVFELNIFGL
jgi:hypothetical protein